jgi:hypothetical protein
MLEKQLLWWFFFTNLLMDAEHNEPFKSEKGDKYIEGMQIKIITWIHMGPINLFHPTTFLCLSQARTWISNVICCGIFLFSMNRGQRWLFVLLILAKSYVVCYTIIFYIYISKKFKYYLGYIQNFPIFDLTQIGKDCIIKRKFKQWWPTILPISTKRIITSRSWVRAPIQ